MKFKSSVTSELTSPEDREILHKYNGDSFMQNDTFSGKKEKENQENTLENGIFSPPP